MNASPHHTLPLATTSPFTRWGHAPVVPAGAWSKTLAETSRGDDGFPARACTGVTAPDSRHQEKSEEQGASLRAIPSPLSSCASTLASRVGTPTHERVADDVKAALHGPSAVPAPAGDIEQAADEPPPAQRAPARQGAGRPPSEAPQLRVHVEQHADGVAVWLGVPAGVAGPGVDALLAALRQAVAPGLALARLTCNGRSVYDPFAPHQENP